MASRAIVIGLMKRQRCTASLSTQSNILASSCSSSSSLSTVSHSSSSSPLSSSYLPTTSSSLANNNLMHRHHFRNHNNSSNIYPASTNGINLRTFTTTTHLKSLDEFFPAGAKDLTEPIMEVNSGRHWRARDLRNKSNTDLHKLWYVLLKERNMLLTYKLAAKNQSFLMAAPERVKKVRKSMASVKVVLGERQRALEEAMVVDAETMADVRSQHPDVDTGIRPQIGSEKAGRVSRMRARPNERERIPDEHPTLLGVQPPNRMVKTLKPRPMTKAERSRFRAELKSRRQQVVDDHEAAILSEIKDLDDSELKEQVTASEFELKDGWDEADLSFRQLSVLKEARSRGVATIYQAKSEPVPTSEQPQQ